MPSIDDKPLSSAELHNRHCFEYLKKLSEELVRSQKFYESFPYFFQFVPQSQKNRFHTYNPYSNYSQLYTTIQAEWEEKYANACSNPNDPEKQEETERLKAIAYVLYHNDNQILESAHQSVVRPIVEAQTPTEANLVSERIRKAGSQSPKKSRDYGKGVISPYEAGGVQERLKAVRSKNYKPQHTTAIPTIQHYNWQPEGRTEYRISTQAQRDEQEGVRVSPLFRAFLTHFNQEKHYVYFNLLRRDARSGLKEWKFGESEKESKMTAQLETLDNLKQGVAVITLPAQDGLMDHHAFTHTKPDMGYKDTLSLFMDVATEKPTTSLKYQDFHISSAMRARLFGEKQEEEIKHLLTSCFEKFSVKPEDKVSEAKRSAVWFHFMNYKLPDFVLQKLNASGFNFSCKDGIDRGGAASLWFNVMSSFEMSKPMTRDEFERGLHAAPVARKGRGMNEHLIRTWNAVNEYVNANIKTLEKDPGKTWLIEWRDMNCPSERVKDVLETRIQQALTRLNELSTEATLPSDNRSQGIASARAVIEAAQTYQRGAFGKGKLLEVVSRTMGLLAHKINQPTTLLALEEKQGYRELIQSLPVKLWKLQACLIRFFDWVFRRDSKQLTGKSMWDAKNASELQDVAKDLEPPEQSRPKF